MEPWSKADQMQCNNRGAGSEKQVSPSEWPQRFSSWQEKTGGGGQHAASAAALPRSRDKESCPGFRLFPCLKV